MILQCSHPGCHGLVVQLLSAIFALRYCVKYTMDEIDCWTLRDSKNKQHKLLGFGETPW
jgi:hypothetical protein